METGRFERLGELMTRMAGGDRDTLFALYEEFGHDIGAVVRREYRRLGVQRVDPDDVAGLVLDACVDLFERARSWDPARGVLPWTWARLRLRQLVSAAVGQFAGPLSPEGVAAEAPCGPTGGPEPDALMVLERLAGERADLRLLREGLDQVSRPGQQSLLLEVRMQACLGDPSPAVTVGRAAGVRPETVRQTVKRVRHRLRRLAATEPRFAPLAGCALLA